MSALVDTITEISEIPDKELLARHARGDDSAFGELVRRHRDRMWAVALRTMGDADEAADALQDAFVSAFRAADRFRGDAAVTTWLHRIVVNACLDRMRRRAVRPAVPMGDDATLDVVARGQTSQGDIDPTDTTDAALDVAAALATLPVEQRAALVLVDMMGYPVDEVARILDIAVGTVKSRCARGRARLLPHLGHLRNPGAAGHVQGREGGSGRP